jgi:16S rRNA (adenine1518-N6/adenine1519-N6)-dimethyltransferase
VVARVLSQRRTVIRKGRAGFFTPQHFVVAANDPGARPETVPMEAYVALANSLQPAS